MFFLATRDKWREEHVHEMLFRIFGLCTSALFKQS